MTPYESRHSNYPKSPNHRVQSIDYKLPASPSYNPNYGDERYPAFSSNNHGERIDGNVRSDKDYNFESSRGMVKRRNLDNNSLTRKELQLLLSHVNEALGTADYNGYDRASTYGARIAKGNFNHGKRPFDPLTRNELEKNDELAFPGPPGASDLTIILKAPKHRRLTQDDVDKFLNTYGSWKHNLKSKQQLKSKRNHVRKPFPSTGKVSRIFVEKSKSLSKQNADIPNI